MDSLNKLELSKLISEYSFLEADKVYKEEIISNNKEEFLKLASEKSGESQNPKEEKVKHQKETVIAKKIRDSRFSEDSMSNMKRMFRNIVKLTHPDVVKDDHLISKYIEAKEAYDSNDLLSICSICNFFNLDIELDINDFDILNELIEIKKEEVNVIEKSWLWVWINGKDEEYKNYIVSEYCNSIFGKDKKNSEEIMKNLEKMLDEIYKISPYKKEYLNKTRFTSKYSAVYGEITKDATDSIVDEFKKHFNNDTVFYDLGCGLGKMVIHIGLKYNVKKSCGIELSKERIKAALDIKSEFCKDSGNIEFNHGDFFKLDINDATVIYIDNTAMSSELAEDLFKIIPKGCLIIFRRKHGPESIRISSPKFKTTYGKTDLYYVIK